MSNIPQAREHLGELAIMLRDIATAIEQIVEEDMRRPFNGRTSTKSVPVTADLVTDVKATKTANPDLSLQQIGDMFSVNSARVSEILGGKYD